MRRIADRAGTQNARRLHGTLVAGQDMLLDLLSHPGYHSLLGKVSSSVDVETQEAHGRVRSSLWPDVGCGGRGFPAWLAEVGARGLRVLLALGELSRQGAPFSGPNGFPDQPRSFSDRELQGVWGLSGGAPHLVPENRAEGPTMRLVCNDQTDHKLDCWQG